MNYEKPINEGDIIDVKIESTGAKGDGIAKINNFVPNNFFNTYWVVVFQFVYCNN